MSKESAKTFLEKFKNDSSFRESLEKTGGEAIQKSLKNEGFEFTKDDLNEALTELGGEEYLDDILQEVDDDVKKRVVIAYGTPTV